MSDECPLTELGAFHIFEDEIGYCPFCGGDAEPTGGGVGHAECESCGEGFWVEL